LNYHLSYCSRSFWSVNAITITRASALRDLRESSKLFDQAIQLFQQGIVQYLLGGMNMSNLDSMLKRNKDFAARQSAEGTLMPSLPQAMPNVKAIIIGCADMRVDPAHVLGITPGEAVVIRNIGGRITPGSLEDLGLLGRIGQVAGKNPGGGGEFHIIVLQHTDCGITRLVGDSALLMHYFQIQEAELKKKAVTDPRAAVAVDVAMLRSIPALPGAWLVSGLVYDVATGLIEVVVPPTAIRAA
jgi:carbonic anhydrase